MTTEYTNYVCFLCCEPVATTQPHFCDKMEKRFREIAREEIRAEPSTTPQAAANARYWRKCFCDAQDEHNNAVLAARDAALEEAALSVEAWNWTHAIKAANGIRALKSQPAPAPPSASCACKGERKHQHHTFKTCWDDVQPSASIPVNTVSDPSFFGFPKQPSAGVSITYAGVQDADAVHAMLAEIAALRQDRDDWKLIAGRMEKERDDLRAKLDAAEKALDEIAGNITIKGRETWGFVTAIGAILKRTGRLA